MMPWFLLPICLLLPGLPVTALLRGKGAGDRLERAWLAVWISVLFTSAAGFALAACGCFSATRVVVLTGLATLAALWMRLRRRAVSAAAAAPGMRAESWGLLALVLASAAVVSRPHEYVRGGWDPGVYLQSGAVLAREGCIGGHDDFFLRLPPDEREAFVHVRRGKIQRFPGFRVIGDGAELSPEFYHLYPVWVALFFSAGGLRAALLANPVFSILALLAVAFTARRCCRPGVSLAAAGLLAANVVQLWFGRFSTSEMLSQFLVWSGVYAFSRHVDGEPEFGMLAGFSFGLALLAHITMLLLLVPVAAVLWWRAVQGRVRADRGMLTALGGMTAAMLLQHRLLCPAYFDVLLYLRVLAVRYAWFLGALAAVAVAGLVFGRRRRPLVAALTGGATVRCLLIAGVAGLAIYAYGIRPHLAARFLETGALRGDAARRFLSNAVAFRQWSWFTTRPGLALAVAGLCGVIWSARTAAQGLLWLLVMTFALVFLHDRSIEPVYLFALRRFVPVLVPAAALLTAVALAVLIRAGRPWVRWAGACVCIGLAAAPLVRGRQAAATADYAGMAAIVERLARVTGRYPEAVVVCDGYEWAAPLYGFHGRRVLAVSDPSPSKHERVQAVVQRWLREGRQVLYLSQSDPPFFDRLDGIPVAQVPFVLRRLEHAVLRYPHRVQARSGCVRVHELRPARREGRAGADGEGRQDSAPCGSGREDGGSE